MRIDDPDEDDISVLKIIMPAALAYIKGYTSLSEEETEKHEDLTIAYLILIEDMFDNRALTVSQINVNRTISTILSMYAVNNVG